MILSYSFPHFERLIQDGTKLHTFRRDTTNRWREGMPIQHWMGSPRNPRSSHPFAGPPVCMGVQEVEIIRTFESDPGFIVHIGGEWQGENRYWHALPPDMLPIVARNDGFATTQEFRDYFLPAGTDIWRGRIIHFTSHKY